MNLGPDRTDAYIAHLEDEIRFLREENRVLREEAFTAKQPRAKAEVEFYRAARDKPPEPPPPKPVPSELEDVIDRSPWAADLYASGHLTVEDLTVMTDSEIEEAARQREAAALARPAPQEIPQ